MLMETVLSVAEGKLGSEGQPLVAVSRQLGVKDLAQGPTDVPNLGLNLTIAGTEEQPLSCRLRPPCCLLSAQVIR